MKTRPNTKEPFTITMTHEGKRLLWQLARKKGVSRSVVLELLVRKEAREEGIPSEDA